MPEVIGMDNSFFKQCTCKNCGAINKYSPAEVRLLWQGKDWSGGSDGAKGFNCAKCNELVIVERW